MPKNVTLFWTCHMDCVRGVMVILLVSFTEDRKFESNQRLWHWYLLKDCVTWNQDNVSKRSDMPTCRLLFQWAKTIKKIQLSFAGLVQSRSHHLIQSNLVSRWYSGKIAHLALNNSHWLAACHICPYNVIHVTYIYRKHHRLYVLRL